MTAVLATPTPDDRADDANGLDPIPRNQILAGDALTLLRTLPDHQIDSLVTSPPYFRLRDYGHHGQLGLEPHVDDWTGHLRQILAEAARLLVPTGTVWLNLGDTYSTHLRQGAPRKSLLLGPERLTRLLIDDGWTIRNKIIWAKTNTIPTSVTDRLATRHEVIYLLTRSTRYYFDLDGLREPHTSRPPRRRDVHRPPGRPDWLGPNSDDDAGLARLHAAGLRGHPLGKNPGDVWQLPVNGFRSRHVATYPEALARRMVLAGTPRLRCTHCRAPWTRTVHRRGRYRQHATRLPPRPSCTCPDAREHAEPGLVLDPFLGSGTTAISAAKLGRDYLGIELNPDFVDLAEKRIRQALRHPGRRPPRAPPAAPPTGPAAKPPTRKEVT